MDPRAALSDSNNFSGSSTICCLDNYETLSPEFAALRRLSQNLESIIESPTPDFDYFTDAKLVVSGGREISVHRCILSARSPFFKSLFAGKESGLKFKLKELAKDFDLSFESLNTVLAYLYSGKVKSLPKDVCVSVCVDEECLHLACRPAVDFLVQVLYGAFIFQISELVALYQRHLLDILDKVAADDVFVILCVANACGTACERLLASCIENIVQSDVDVITLDKAIPHDIVKQIVESRLGLGLHKPENNSFPDKHVQRIHRALDSDDVELVGMLLKEGHTTLDDAYALHYAVAYCDAKTTTELLDLALADVNHKNSRGYSVLHIAAIRREPKIIVSLLTKGARPSDLTSDGRKALHISKRLTRAVDYYKSIEEGKACPKDRLCVEILEQEERSDPPQGEAFVSPDMTENDLCVRFLLYLELRVGLAKLMFPREAKVAMDIAQVDGTSEFPLAASMHSRNMADAQRTMVDPIEVPFEIKEEHLNRLRALAKTVKLGKRYFPRCSEVLDKIVDAEDLTELAYLGNGTLEERQLKKRKYMELQDDLRKAFTEDKEELNKSELSASSSSTSNRVMRPNGKPTFKK